MKIATWNINSLRVRQEQVNAFLEKYAVDFLALQETKVQDQDFPKEVFQSLGYHVIYAGQKTYNGVAWLTRQPVQCEALELPDYPDSARRVLGVAFENTFLLNLYVPNGSELGSEKYTYKLDWLLALKNYMRDLKSRYEEVIVLGDFNIAPTDLDVYNPDVWRDCLLVSPKERAALKALLDEGYFDAYRLVDQKKGGFSWWDYRHNAYLRDMGLRIDLVLVNEKAKDALESVYVAKEFRALERPSDHAPLIAEFGD